MSFIVKLNAESVSRIINAKCRRSRLFIFPTWLKYYNKKIAESFY